MQFKYVIKMFRKNKECYHIVVSTNFNKQVGRNFEKIGLYTLTEMGNREAFINLDRLGY